MRDLPMRREHTGRVTCTAYNAGITQEPEDCSMFGILAACTDCCIYYYVIYLTLCACSRSPFVKALLPASFNPAAPSLTLLLVDTSTSAPCEGGGGGASMVSLFVLPISPVLRDLTAQKRTKSSKCCLLAGGAPGIGNAKGGAFYVAFLF